MKLLHSMIIPQESVSWKVNNHGQGPGELNDLAACRLQWEVVEIAATGVFKQGYGCLLMLSRVENPEPGEVVEQMKEFSPVASMV